MKVTGLDLASLDKAGQDQLALLAARKGIVFFASNDKVKQTYRDTSMERKLEMARYYGQLHQHSVQPRPPTSTEISVVYQDKVNTVRVRRRSPLSTLLNTDILTSETLVAQPTHQRHLAHRPDPRATATRDHLLLLHAA